MDSSNVLVLLEQLDDEVDDLEESLGPLIKTALSETTSKLPLLDKAKLFVLVTYAIESVLFSYLRLNGVNAREHPVFIELTRVKQYFDKIKSTEPAAPRTSTLDKAAAARFVNPSLASAEKEALKQAEIRAKERARAHIKFDELSKNIAEKGKALKQKAGQGNRATDDGSSSSDSSCESEVEPAKKPRKKRKVDKSKLDPRAAASSSGNKSPKEEKPISAKKKRPKGRQKKKGPTK